MRRRSASAVSALAICSVWGAHAARAADAPRPAATTVDEVVVTAERRESTVQNTPIAMTAVNAEQIAQRGIQSVQRLTQTTPSVKFNTIIDNAIITIRGIGARTNNAGGDPSVAYHIDGVYISRLASINGSFFDVARIEVLRGPQGTLYGRNATGGAINVISNAPQLGVYTGQADVTFGSYGRAAFRTVLNAPIGEKTALRVAGMLDSRDGYVKQLGVGGDRNDDRNAEIKAQLRVAPTDDVDLVLRSTYDTKWGTGPSQKTLTFNRPVLGFFSLSAPPPAGYGLTSFNTNPYETVEDAGGRLRTITAVQSGTLTVNNVNLGPLGAAQWTTIGAYEYFRSSYYDDNDGLPVPIAATNPQFQRSRQASVESRLASQGDGPLQWLLGVFYLHEHARDDIAATIRAPVGPPILANPFADVKTNSWAVFGQGTYKVTDAWSLTGGLRYTEDRKSSLSHPSLGPKTLTASKDSWSAVTGKAGIEFRPQAGSLYYASASRGYKSGGYGLDATPFNPEYIWSYEIGAKNSFLDHKLILDGAAFYYDYTNLQVPELVGGLTQVILNAARARIKGVEADAIFRPVPDLRLDANVSYLDAKFREFVSADEAFPAAGPVNLAGKPLPNSPKWSGSAGAEYTLHFGAFGEVTPRVDVTWTTKYNLRMFGVAPYDIQEGYAKVDFNVHWTSPSRTLYVDVFGSNIGDKTTYDTVIVNNLVNEWQAVVAPPSMYGVRVGFSF